METLEIWLLRDSRQWPAIYSLNKDQIRDPNLIYPGQVLIMPEAV